MTIVDVAAFASQDFNAGKLYGHLNGLFSKFTSEDVRTFHQSLEEAKLAAAADLQKNVFKNYVEFVNISKEISALEGDILSLKNLLKELTDAILEDLDANAPAGSSSGSNIHLDVKLDSVNNARYSEDDVAMKKGQITNLYEFIEGLQKVLPISNSRYVVKDGFSTRFWEVNPATFRQRQPVQIFLLNDSVLVTSRKKSKCLRLSDCAIIDIKDSPDITNAFKVMCHPDVYLFRSEESEEKRQLLAGTANGKKKHSGDAAIKKGHVEPPKDKVLVPGVKPMDNGRNDLVWIKELPHELDVSVANRDFQVAVALIERARSLLYGTSSPSAVQTHVQPLYERISRLSSLISNDLANPVCTKTQAKLNIELLQRLGLEDQARDVFLDSRSQALHSLIRQVQLLSSIKWEVSVYVDSMANTVFSFIRYTCDWYNVASGFLKWVRREVERFGSTVRRQVFEAKQPFDTIAVCLEHITLHCKQLRDVGLDLHFVLDHLFFNDIVRSIEGYAEIIKLELFSRSKVTVSKFFAGRPEQLQELKMDAKAYSLFSIYCSEFGSDMSLLISISLYAKIVSCLKDFFSTYIVKVLDIFEKPSGYQQNAIMISNVVFIVEHMLPTVSSQLSVNTVERPIPELDDHKEKSELESSFIRKTAGKLYKELYNMDFVDYSSGASILDEASPSEPCFKVSHTLVCIYFLRFSSELYLFATQVGKPLDCRKLLRSTLESLFVRLNKADAWETPKGPRRFGFGGIQQLILDMHYLIRSCESIVSPKSNEIANSICEKALRAYFSQNPDIKGTFEGEWYDKRVDAAVRCQPHSLQSILAQA
ncbi:hypothetical protein BC829DRAFT_400805 [Chytridium lagenaria]|nr:hypothetical protein BC829DRAFT_400805 [Chytridium lagenaria]